MVTWCGLKRALDAQPAQGLEGALLLEPPRKKRSGVDSRSDLPPGGASDKAVEADVNWDFSFSRVDGKRITEADTAVEGEVARGLV